MTTLTTQEFRMFVKNMSQEYASNLVERELYNDLNESYEEVKRENELLKKTITKLSKENMQLYMKCKQQELNEQKEKARVQEMVQERAPEKVQNKDESKEIVKLDTAYFRKKLNL
jgi:hypothetical protein